MIQDGNRGVAMGHAVAVRTDYTADKVRRLAKRVKDAAQARRLLAIAAVLDGASRTAAARIGGMDRQTLRDWVIRFNDQGPDGLINIPSPSLPPKLNPMHRAFLARIVEEGPIPAIHGVVRWRACDLISEGLQTGPRGHGGVQKNFSARAAEELESRALRHRSLIIHTVVTHPACGAGRTDTNQPTGYRTPAHKLA